jgi:hypothetical protein
MKKSTIQFAITSLCKEIKNIITFSIDNNDILTNEMKNKLYNDSEVLLSYINLINDDNSDLKSIVMQSLSFIKGDLEYIKEKDESIIDGLKERIINHCNYIIKLFNEYKIVSKTIEIWEKSDLNSELENGEKSGFIENFNPEEFKLDLKKGLTINERVIQWLTNGDTGLSSKSMLYILSDRKYAFQKTFEKFGLCLPNDSDDFGRCYRLIKLIPELKENFDKLSDVSPNWELFVDNWEKLSHLYENNEHDKVYNLLDIINLKII